MATPLGRSFPVSQRMLCAALPKRLPTPSRGGITSQWPVQELVAFGLIRCAVTFYLQRATDALRKQGPIGDALLPYLSPLGWEHINLTGDYLWRSRSVPPRGAFRHSFSP